MKTYKLTKYELRQLIQEEASLVEGKSLVTSLTLDNILLEKQYPNLGKEFFKNDRVAFFVAGNPPEYNKGVVSFVYERAQDGLDIIGDDGSEWENIRPRYVWLEGEEPNIDDVADEIDAEAGIDTVGEPGDFGLDRTEDPEEPSMKSMIILGVVAWAESFDAITALKEQLTEMALEQFGVEPTDPIGVVVSNTFANLKVAQLNNYFGGDAKVGARQLAELIVKSISGMIADVSGVFPIAELMGLEPGKGKADVILSYIKVSLVSDFSKTALGEKLIVELAEKIYKIRLDISGWLESKLLSNEAIKFIQDFVEENVGMRPPASVVKKAIKTGVFDFGDAAGLVIDSVFNKAGEMIDDWLKEGIEDVSHKLTSLDLRQIIKEEIQLLSKRPQEDVLQEGWFLPALGAVILGSIGTVLGTAVILSSPITHKLLDWTVEWIETDWPWAATYIKTRISDSILEGIGWDGNERGIVNLVIPPIIANTKLHRLDDYLDLEGDRREFAGVIVESMNQILARGIVVEKLLIDGLGLDRNSWLGGHIMTIVEVSISEFLDSQAYTDTLTDVIADLMSPEELKSVVEDAMKEASKDKGMFDTLVDKAGKFALGL
tara:strand:- start:4518 stop:6326 length:1809 start_codon:yes stop_codon:yes gene_type:complete